MEVAKNNAQRDMTEIRIASFSAAVAILMYFSLRKLTSDTTKHRNERLNKKKIQKARQIQAEKDEVIKKYENRFSSNEFNWTAPMKTRPSFGRSYSAEQTLNMPICFQTQRKTSKSMNNAPSCEKSMFNFEPYYIEKFLKNQQFENDTAFPGGTRVPDTPFSPGENYKDWSLRRRDVQVMLMD